MNIKALLEKYPFVLIGGAALVGFFVYTRSKSGTSTSSTDRPNETKGYSPVDANQLAAAMADLKAQIWAEILAERNGTLPGADSPPDYYPIDYMQHMEATQ